MNPASPTPPSTGPVPSHRPPAADAAPFCHNSSGQVVNPFSSLELYGGTGAAAGYTSELGLRAAVRTQTGQWTPETRAPEWSIARVGKYRYVYVGAKSGVMRLHGHDQLSRTINEISGDDSRR